MLGRADVMTVEEPSRCGSGVCVLDDSTAVVWVGLWGSVDLYEQSACPPADGTCGGAG